MKILGLAWGTGIPAAGAHAASESNNAAFGLREATVKPRHVLCFLGAEGVLPKLTAAANKAITEFATGFSIDREFTQDTPDDRMPRSFSVCWDRVHPEAWTKKDEDAVAGHGCVLYVLGPPMEAKYSVQTSAAALLMIFELIEAGSVAVKGESAGVAHGLPRWRELALAASAAIKSNDDFALSRICRLALAKRPLSSETHLESVGFHLVGLPEVWVSQCLGSEMKVVGVMDEVADEMTRNGVDPTVTRRGGKLDPVSGYEEDSYKFNPYGILVLDRT
ncbi:hypothetical protein [Labrys neptuniae]